MKDKPRYSIFIEEEDGTSKFFDDTFNPKEAKEKAKNIFNRRLNRQSEVYVEKKIEFLRLKNETIGFRKG